MKYAVLIPCGPAELEIERITDLLEALVVHDPVDCVVALIVHDANPLAGRLLACSPKVRVEPNPRMGEGWGWGGGLIAGELWAWEFLAREYPELRCVIKMDSDALTLRSVSAGLDGIFADPSVGMAGARLGDEPRPPYRTAAPLGYFRRKVRKLRAPVSLWRKPRWHLRFACCGAHRWIAGLYSAAERNGYLPGELIMGGAFAVSMECVRRLVALGVTRRWRDFLDLPVSDDILLTMLPYLAGLRAVETPLFSIEPAALRFAPEDLVLDPQVGVVHSVKSYRELSESVIRSIFREHRSPQQ